MYYFIHIILIDYSLAVYQMHYKWSRQTNFQTQSMETPYLSHDWRCCFQLNPLRVNVWVCVPFPLMRNCHTYLHFMLSNNSMRCRVAHEHYLYLQSIQLIIDSFVIANWRDLLWRWQKKNFSHLVLAIHLRPFHIRCLHRMRHLRILWANYLIGFYNLRFACGHCSCRD